MDDITPEVQLPTLDSLIREALQASTDPNPESAADLVVAAIAPENREHYLRQAVASRISTAVGYERARNTPVPVRKGVSTKQSLIRDQYWPAFLRQRVFLPTGYKFLADATSQDLRVVAEQRVAQAQELSFRAGQFTALADLMDKSRAKTLGALDPSKGQQLLERAA